MPRSGESQPGYFEQPQHTPFVAPIVGGVVDLGGLPEGGDGVGESFRCG
jgi:hypothetical protein